MSVPDDTDVDAVIDLADPQLKHSYHVDLDSMESVMDAMMSLGFVPHVSLPEMFVEAESTSPIMGYSTAYMPPSSLTPRAEADYTLPNDIMPTRSPSYYSSRGRSRTRSPYTPYSRERDLSPQYSERSYYSDSFHSDDSRRRRRSRSRTPPSHRRYSKPGAKKSKVTVPKFKTGVKKANTKKPLKKSGAATSTPRPGGAHDVVTKRMLSARRLKINELRNEIDTLMKALNEIRSENKALKRDNVLQNKQLDRLQDQEGELPQMIDSHNREVRALKEQIRKWKDKNERVSRNLRNTEDELTKSQRKVKKLQEIADDKKLEERDELSRRLNKAENNLEEKTHRIQQLERHIENLEKSHRREIVTELKKHAALKLELEAVRSDLDYTKVHLRDREKELEVRNIYQNRIALAQRGGSVASLPALEPPARYQPPPKSPEISPRHRAKQFEQKRREEHKAKAKELNVPTFDSPNSATRVPPIKASKTIEQPHRSRQEHHQQKPKKAPPQKVAEPKPTADPVEQSNNGATKTAETKPPDTPKFDTENSWDAIFKKQQKISGPQAPKDSLEDSFNTSFNKSRDGTFVKPQPSKSFFSTEIPEDGLEDERRGREKEEKDRRERQQKEEQWKREQEEKERRNREERDRRDREEKERRDREENERRAREERERYQREQQRQQNEEREAREKEVQRAREAEERERRFREEAEQRARAAREQEKQRLESDTRAAEERRKKDLLLQKMKEIDSGSSAPPPALGLQSKASLKNTEATFGGDFFLTSGDGDASSNNKDYSFRKTDENLFRGIPANRTSKSSSLFGDDNKAKDNPLFPASKKVSLFDDSNDDLDFGGYQPSSLASSKPAGSRAKPQAETNNTWKVKDGSNAKTSVLNDIFSDDSFSSSKPKPAASEQKSSFPWDSDKPTTPNKILPLRPRANHATIHNKPTIRAIDDFDDDLEEVVL